VSGPRKGPCYEGADGEGQAISSEEELATVFIPSSPDARNSDGGAYPDVDLRDMALADADPNLIVATLRQARGALAGSDRLNFLIEQLNRDVRHSRGCGFCDVVNYAHHNRGQAATGLGLGLLATCAGFSASLCVALTPAVVATIGASGASQVAEGVVKDDVGLIVEGGLNLTGAGSAGASGRVVTALGPFVQNADEADAIATIGVAGQTAISHVFAQLVHLVQDERSGGFK